MTDSQQQNTAIPKQDASAGPELSNGDSGADSNPKVDSLSSTSADRALPNRSNSRTSRQYATKEWLDENSEKLKVYIEEHDCGQYQELLSETQALVQDVQDHELVAKHLAKLKELAKDDSKAQEIILQCAGLPVVLHVMAWNQTCAEPQIQGCLLIAILAADNDDVQEYIGSLHGIDSVLDAMSNHGSDSAVQDAASQALRALTWSATNRQVMARHGALQDLVSAMRGHPNDGNLQEHLACTAAHVVYGNPDSRLLFGKVGGVTAILDAMRRHPDNVLLQAQCCFAIRNLSWDCPENHSLMHQGDADDLLMTAMERFPKIPGLQDQALAALGNLMFHDDETFRQTVERKHSKTLQALVFAALQTFRSNPSIILNAQRLLINLVELGRGNHEQGFEEMATTEAAASSMLRPVASRSDRTGQTTINVSLLIQQFCTVDAFRDQVCKGKGIEILLDSTEQYVEIDQNVSVASVEALIAIMSGSDEAKRLFNECSGVLRISEVMEKCRDAEALQTQACSLLDNVSNGQEEATADRMMNKEEAVKSVIEAMTAFPNAASLQEHGCSLMIKIAATNHANTAMLNAAGAVPVVERARALHSGNHSIESLANQLLLLLVVTDSPRGGRGATPRGSASSRLRSRSRAVEKGARSRSRMDRSKSPGKNRRTRALPTLAEHKEEECEEQEESIRMPPARSARQARRCNHGNSLEAVPE